MTWVATAVVGGSIIGGVVSSGAARSAANTQADATQAAQDAQERMYERQVQLNEPFRLAGVASQNRLMELLGIRSPTTPAGGTPSEFVTNPNSPDFGKYARDFGAADFQTDPGYAFRLSEGMKALDRTAAARGGLLSGATLKGAERFNQGLASDEYQRAYERYNTNRANQLNPLMGYASGPGLSATSASSNAAQQFGAQTGQNLQDIGTARASGYLGSANALSGALNTAGNLYMYNNRTNALRST
ncbi:MAG: hypothetical protein EBQ98_00320 [Actinobacteria bacterium]|nr:hypothetical protein [Actinomycetota bacterium]